MSPANAAVTDTPNGSSGTAQFTGNPQAYGPSGMAASMATRQLFRDGDWNKEIIEALNHKNEIAKY